MMLAQIPRPNLYKKFGDPHKLVEFRVFSFNSCSAGCKNCFYKKSDNHYYDFESVRKLAAELAAHDYSLETLYLLPTDVFENDFNYKVFEDPEFIKAANLFSYIGLATALSKGFDQKFLESFFRSFPGHKIEMHVNLKEDLLGSAEYLAKLRSDVRGIKALFGDQILLNLALNLGTPVLKEDMVTIDSLVEELSDDRILELNFTFLFNSQFPQARKTQMLLESYPVIQHFSDLFGKNEQSYNSRTLLRKPSFVFKDEKVFLTPIIPFDEYVFVDDAACRLTRPDFESFLESYSKLEALNTPIIPECDSCEMLSLCHGKHFFSMAHMLHLDCLKEVGK